MGTPRVKNSNDAALETSITFSGSNPNHRVEIIDGLDFRLFKIDPRIQRDQRPHEINKILKSFNPHALGVFTVSVREETAYDTKNRATTVQVQYLLDGQQRQEVLNRLNWDGTVTALVHYNLTLAEEARLFLDLNERDLVNPWDRYKNRLVAEEPQALAIKEILDQLRIRLGGPTGFSAISRADRIYARGPKGVTNLRWALQVLKDVYGRYDGRVMEALAFIHDEFADYIDTESLRAKLLHNAPDINRLTGQGLVVQQLYHCTVAVGIAEAIIGFYNKHTRKGGKTTSALPSLINRNRKPSWRNKEELARFRDEDINSPIQPSDEDDYEDDEE